MNDMYFNKICGETMKWFHFLNKDKLRMHYKITYVSHKILDILLYSKKISLFYI